MGQSSREATEARARRVGIDFTVRQDGRYEVQCQRWYRVRALKHIPFASTMCGKCASHIASNAAAEKSREVPFMERLMANLDITPGGCWTWTGHCYSNGYSIIAWRATQHLGHRLSFRFFRGEIPDGLQLDHLCRNRACVNPTHLEPVTAMENTRRAMRSHCVNGHPFDVENTWMHKGKRYCRECRRRRVREYLERRSSAQIAS